jgi:cystathionine beta-lyase
MAHVEATYLAWIDCSSVPDAAALFLKNGVAVYEGKQFGDARFIRLNFGTQRKVLGEALRRISASLTISSRPSPRG